MRYLNTAVLVVLLTGLTILPGCDIFNVETRTVSYSIQGFGDFPAVRADFIEFTNSAGQLVRVNNVLLPHTETFEIASGTEITLRAQRRAAWSEVGLHIAISVDGQERWTDQEAGMDSPEHHTQIVSITRILP